MTPYPTLQAFNKLNLYMGWQLSLNAMMMKTLVVMLLMMMNSLILLWLGHHHLFWSSSWRHQDHDYSRLELCPVWPHSGLVTALGRRGITRGWSRLFVFISLPHLPPHPLSSPLFLLFPSLSPFPSPFPSPGAQQQDGPGSSFSSPCPLSPLFPPFPTTGRALDCFTGGNKPAPTNQPTSNNRRNKPNS